MDEQPAPKRQSTFPLFSRHFAIHPLDVVNYAQNKRKQMEDFIEAFRKRIEVEVNYSKNLNAVSKSLDRYIQPGTDLAVSYICSAFKVQHEQRGRQALQLAESLKTQIENMCVEMNKTNYVGLKKLEKDIKKYYKEAENHEDNHRGALQNYQGINKEMEEMIITKNIMKYTSNIPQQKKLKLITKTMDSIKESKQYEKLYIQTVKNFNQFVELYSKEVTSQLDSTETWIREQVVMQSDCMRKLIVAEVSMFKNIEYDLLNISKQMEHLDTQRDVEVFSQELKNVMTNRIVPEEKEKEEEQKRSSTNSIDIQQTVIPSNTILDPKKMVGKSMLSQSILYVQEEYFNWMLTNKKNKRLRALIQQVWKMNRNKNINKQTKEQQSTKEPGNQEQSDLPKIQENNVENGLSKKQQTIPQGQKIQSVPAEWEKQMKDMIATFKILKPPNFIQPVGVSAMPSHQTIQTKFIEITSNIAALWNGVEIDQQSVKTRLASLEAVLSEHHLYRLIAYIFIEQYRIQHQVIITTPNNAKLCGKVIRSILKESNKKNDVFIIRGILGLVFTFYWIEDKTKRLLYQNQQVYQCSIWKKLDYWEAAIFETTYQQMAVFVQQKGQTQAQTILRQKNIIFSQLASFCHYMIMLGITNKNVRLIVGRYCRLYEMTEQQNKDLSKMITNTAKQFKQTPFQFSLKGQRESQEK